MKSLFTVYITCSLFYLILLIYRIKKKKLAIIASQSSQSPFLVRSRISRIIYFF